MVAATALPIQAFAARRVILDVPFSFSAGETTLPAGWYSLEKEGRNVLLIRNAAQEVRAIVRVTPMQPVALSGAGVAVVFNRYGNAYFISEIRAAGHGLGLSIQESRSEREAARNLQRFTVTIPNLSTK